VARWSIVFAPQAGKELKKLGKPAAARIIKVLEERVATLEDPRDLGKPLVGEWSGYWRWRVGDYRVIAKIEDEQVVIVIVRVAHRSGVY
jgi:mRNA interferase RelE/StbE